MLTLEEVKEKIQTMMFNRKFVLCYFRDTRTLYVSFENEDDSSDDVQIGQMSWNDYLELKEWVKSI